MRKKWKIGMKETRLIMKGTKNFEKLMKKTIAMREKIKKMQLAFPKAQGMDDCLYNIGA